MECLWQNSIPSPPCSHLSLQFLLFSRRSIFRLLKDQHLFRAQRSAVHQVRDLATIHCSFCQLHVALIVSTFHPPERCQNTFTLLEVSQSFERLNKPMVPKGLDVMLASNWCVLHFGDSACWEQFQCSFLHLLH